MDAGFGVGFGLFFSLISLLALGTMVVWIIFLVEVIRIPDVQFQVAGTEKTTWVVIVAIAGWIGAVAWVAAKRREVLAAEGQVPPAPPGWYWLPDGSEMCWWDGAAWTEHTHRPPPPVEVS
jgi:hypothetical protein